MRNPAGVECPYFYGNYYRGKNQEECRLIGAAPPPSYWTPDLCKNCPVPGILRANTCPNMILSPSVSRSILGRHRKVKISAYCTKNHRLVNEPHIGCGDCHTLPSLVVDDNR